MLAWLEEASDTAPPSVRIAALSEKGQLTSNVSVVPIEHGLPLGLGMDCAETSCRVLVSLDADGAGELWGFEWRKDSTNLTARRITGLGAPSNVAPVVRGNAAYVADRREGAGLLRKLGLEW